jgi:hypothetical protein
MIFFLKGFNEIHNILGLYSPPKKVFSITYESFNYQIFFDKMILDHFMYNLEEQMMPQ